MPPRIIPLATIAAVLISLSFALPTAAEAARAGNGARCTIVGTPRADHIKGTNKSDVICGRGGNDIIDGRGGNDVIDGGSGTDTIRGGSGSDRLVGGSGDDKLTGGQGDDQLRGGAGSDLLFGDAGADVLDGGAANDTVAGGGDADRLLGGGGDDALDGGGANDSLFGQPGNDSMLGGPGSDRLDGGTGTNTCDFTGGEPTVASCRYDVTGPTIVSVSANPAQVMPGRKFVVRALVIDPIGVAAVGLQAIRDGASSSSTWCDSYAARTSGTATNGTWTMTCTVPATATNGTYTIYPYAQDAAGNWTNTNGGDESTTRGTFTVTGGGNDIHGPTIASVHASPAIVGPGQTLTITANVSDTAGVLAVGLQAIRDGASSSSTWCDSYAARTSGTATNGIWTMTCTVPATATNGTYTIYPYAQDAAGNWTNTNGGDESTARGTFVVE